MNKIKILLIAITLVAIVVLVYKKQSQNHYETAQTIRGDANITVNGVGSVASVNVYKMTPLYGGEISGLTIDIGDYVKKGDLIASIDSVDLKEQINQQKAILKKTHYDIASLVAQKKIAQAKYKYQNDLYRRNKDIQSTIAISSLLKYQNEKELAQLSIESIEANIESAKALVEQIKSVISGLEIRVSKYTLYAPSDGYITNKFIANGQIVTPNQPIVELINPIDIIIRAFIDAKESTFVKIGNHTKVKLRSINEIQNGQVVKIYPTNHHITQEREIEIKLIDNKEKLYINEQAIVDIVTISKQNAIKIPTKSIKTYNGDRGVWTINNDKLYFQKIEILAIDEHYTIIDKEIKFPILLPNAKQSLSLKNGMSIND